MNIGIDGRTLQYPMCGINRYIYFLLKNMGELNQEHTYYLFYKNINPDLDFTELLQHKKIKWIKLYGKNKFIQNILLPFYIKKFKIHVFHCPANYGIPPFHLCKNVLTIQDLTPLKMPDYWQGRTRREKRMYQTLLRQSIKRADKIIAISEATKKDIFNFFSINENKIKKICLAISLPQFINMDVQKKYGINKPYFVHITGQSKHKNTEFAIDSFKKIKSDIKLVIVGQSYMKLNIEELKKENIIITGMIPDQDLAGLMQSCLGLIFISQYEGFGLPVLEAFSLGVPVIGLNTEVNQELFGAKMDYIFSLNSDELKNKMQEMIGQKEKKSEELKEYAKQFNWMQTAKETIKVYEEAVKYKDLWSYRFFDILLACIGMILFSPVFVIASLAIFLKHGRPIFYSQERVGRQGKIFRIWKFRSMIKDAEKITGPVLAAGEKDSRITGIGKILRATAMDELPQIFNIFIGDMSVVGPRAERPFFVEQFKKEIPCYDMRHRVRPGLTGMAQLYGRYNTTARQKLRFDLLCIKNQNVFLYFKLIALSVFITLKGKWSSLEKKR